MATISGILPLGGWRDDSIAPLAGIATTKFVHNTTHNTLIAGEAAAIVAGSFPLLVVNAETARIIAFSMTIFGRFTGDRTASVDLQKSTGGGAFATILTSPVSFDDTCAPRTTFTGVLFDLGLLEGDILRLVVTVGGSTGDMGTGLLVTLTTRDPGGMLPGSVGTPGAITNLQTQIDALQDDVEQLQIDVLNEVIDVERDLGCIPMSVNTSFDNYALLAPAFLYSGAIPRSIRFPAKRYRINSTLHTTHRGGLTIRGMGGMATPRAENGVLADYFSTHSVLVWGGAAGGTMVQLNGNQANWSNLALQGQLHLTNENAVTYSIDYNLGADIGIYMRDGLEGDLTATPPYGSPGRWNFENLCLNSLRYGFKAGGSAVPNSNHADHCVFTGLTQFNWCDTGFWLAGGQAVQFQFQMITPLEVRRVFQVDQGGQIAVSCGRLQGISAGSTYPTWIYFNGADITHGRFQFKSLHVDGTLANGFRIVDYNDAQPPYGLLATIEIDGFSTDMHGYSGAAFDAKCGPIFRLGGPMHLTVRNGYALEERSLEMTGMTSGWFERLDTVDCIPWAVFHDCNFSDIGFDHDPTEIVRTGVGESSGKRVVRWFNCRHLRGNPIPDDVDEVL